MGASGAKKWINALEHPDDKKVRLQPHDGNFWRSKTPPQFLPFQRFFGNKDPIQIAPKLSATVT